MNSMWQFASEACRGIGSVLLILLIKAWQIMSWAGRGTGRGLLFSLTKGWQFTSWAGRGMGRGLAVFLIKAWQFTRWVSRGTGRGLWFSLSKTWQFTCWATPRTVRGLWLLLSRTCIVLLWVLRELLILLFKMVNGPKRGLTVFAALVLLLYLWEHQWGGVRHPILAVLTVEPTFTVLTWAGILAGIVDLGLIYGWVKNRLSTKTYLPVPVKREQVYQHEQPHSLLRFPSKKVYSDLEKTQALVSLSESKSVSSVSTHMDIPQSTLRSWKNKYQKESNFRSRIDTLIMLVVNVKKNSYDSKSRIETNDPH